MANENLTHKLTADELRKGGKNSGAARKRKKDLREAMQALLDSKIKDKNGKSMSGTEAMAAKAFQAALKGDWKAWELCRDTAGQKPVDKVVVADVDPDVIDEVERMVLEDDDTP